MGQPIEDNGKDYPLTFASRQLNSAKKNYTTIEKECLAMVFSVKKFRHYLLLNLVVFFDGQIERVNRTLVNIPKKTITNSKNDWNTKLLAALWAYTTTFNVTTQATTFSLVYGVEAILPIDFEIPFL